MAPITEHQTRIPLYQCALPMINTAWNHRGIFPTAAPYSSMCCNATGGSEAQLELGSSAVQQWGHVAVGGTFDRLHAGHRILLAAAALAATEAVYIGVTGAELLRNKVRECTGVY